MRQPCQFSSLSGIFRKPGIIDVDYLELSMINTFSGSRSGGSCEKNDL